MNRKTTTEPVCVGEVVFILYLGDCIKILNDIPKESVDLIFADPPYFLSNGGLSIHNGKIVSVNKGEWDKKENYQSIKDFTKQWILGCKKVLKKKGSIWVCGTFHNNFMVTNELLECGFKIINIVIWRKTDPPPLIFKNKMRFSYEMIIWAKLESHYFDYPYGYSINNSELTDIWDIHAVQMNEKKFGYHPTQKPEELLKRIIKISSKESDKVLDPFMGSGTTGVVAISENRDFIGIEKDEKYFKIAQLRIFNLKK